jgi:C4-dicarboxylate-specific signal transduction histidine kinase
LDQGLEKVTDSVQEIVNRVQQTPLLATQDEHKLSPILSDAGEKLSEAQSVVHELRILLSRLKNLETRAIALEAEMGILEDQLTQFSELAGLGLTAEALSHEIHTVADRLAERTRFLTEVIKTKKVADSDIITYTEYVHSAISTLRKQLSHLAPSLRYVRETKDKISLQDFFEELHEFYSGRSGRFKGSGIKMVLENPFDNFVILINKGKLTQIVDNIILNSEYWLKEAVRRKEIGDPTITIRSEYPYVSIFDNGIGIDRSIENSLFQPFVTTKPKNIGRGLGLFIVRELLDSSGCNIMLLPETNSFGHRFIFQIDFTGVVHGSQK